MAKTDSASPEEIGVKLWCIIFGGRPSEITDGSKDLWEGYALDLLGYYEITPKAGRGRG